MSPQGKRTPVAPISLAAVVRFPVILSSGCGPEDQRHVAFGGGYAAVARTDKHNGFGPYATVSIPTRMQSSYNRVDCRLTVTDLRVDDPFRDRLWKVDLGTRSLRPLGDICGFSRGGWEKVWDSSAAFHFGEGDIWGLGMTQCYGLAFSTGSLTIYALGGFNVWLGDSDDDFDSGIGLIARVGATFGF